MNIKITARKFKAHDSLREFINDEVKSLEKFSDEIMDVDVILSYVNQKDSEKTAEIVLKVPGQILKAEETTDDFKISVTATVEKLRRQLDKLKTKRIPHL